MYDLFSNEARVFPDLRNALHVVSAFVLARWLLPRDTSPGWNQFAGWATGHHHGECLR